MKRILPLVLILMIFTVLLVNATDKKVSEFADVDGKSGYSTEISTLSDSGILQGYENGDFHPDDEITRAEFAAVLCRTIGVEEEAKTEDMKNRNYFTDVPPNHWAAGYINAGYDYGAINGVGAGIFMPEQPVTNKQVIKMLIAAWGYTLEAEKLGGYPNGYMEVANKYGVLDTVSFNYGNASKRWVVSMFVYGVLEKVPVSETAENKPNPPALPSGDVTEGKKEPLSEYNGKFPDDPVGILKKVTPQSAKYEEKAFVTTAVDTSYLPFRIDGARIEYFADISNKLVDFSVNDPAAKDNGRNPSLFAFRASADNRVLDLSSLSEGEWEFCCEIKEKAVSDSYIGKVIKSNGLLSFKGLWRSVTLNVRDKITETTNKITLSNSAKNELSPFDLRTQANQQGKILLYIDYPFVINKPSFFDYSLKTEGEPILARGKIDGANEKINPVVIENIRPNVSYFFYVGVHDNYGSNSYIQGYITFTYENGAADFNFEGDYRTSQIDGYEIVDYI